MLSYFLVAYIYKNIKNQCTHTIAGHIRDISRISVPPFWKNEFKQKRELNQTNGRLSVS